MSRSSALIFQWENHCACTLELPPFVCTSASIHAGTSININASEPLCLFLNPISVPVTLSPGILVCPCTGVLIYLHIPNKTQAAIINKQG